MPREGGEGVDPVFVALADPTRRRVLMLLAESGAASATQLADLFPITRQAMAKHLQVLSQAGLVAGERRGRETRWSLTPDQLAPAMAWMAGLGGHFGERVAALQRHLGDRQHERGIGFRPPLPVAARRRDAPPRSRRPDPPPAPAG